MKLKFEAITNQLLSEEPITMPAPVTKPRPGIAPSRRSTPAPTRPAPNNPSPFRRHQPGQMPQIKPKAGIEPRVDQDLKQNLLDIIQKHSKFFKD